LVPLRPELLHDGSSVHVTMVQRVSSGALRRDGYAPIRDYAAIGDGRTVALVALDGAIDWLCLPDIDSPSVFAAVLDAERGGSFAITPTRGFESERRYRQNSNVLETTFRTSAGVVRITDGMTLASSAQLTPLREIVRRVECVEGSVGLSWHFDPRLDYAQRMCRLVRRGDLVFAEAGANAIVLAAWGVGDSTMADGRVSGMFSLSETETAVFSLTATGRQPAVLVGRDDASARLDEADRFWREWTETLDYEGPWQDAVLRSALALKLLVFAPSGAIVAAATTSLPEELGGSRNWDYRYTWLRDAAYTLDAFASLGYEDEAHAFFWWLMHATRLTQPRLQVLYRVNGAIHADETELEHLRGYRNSSPVRIGNGATEQVQLDVYGAILDATWRHVRAQGDLGGETGRTVAKIADYVAEHWSEPDSGIWEVRSEPTHFIQSKVMCWVALDRAARLADEGVLPDRARGWRREGEEIRRFIDAEGWDEGLGSYIRATNLRELDASLLLLPIVGFDGSGPRVAATVDAVRRELAHGSLVYRYRGRDGLEGEDGPFLTCSFWLVDALARLGRLGEARELMGELVGLANDVGLYAEEIDAESGDFLGNFPQALVHLALINAAVSITERERAA
jgi:GH15 family glucan-1,4-alpha-glucosidase